MKYELRIDDGVCDIYDIKDAIEIINDVLDEHFNIRQIYLNYYGIPFSAAVLEGILHDESTITDEQIVFFERAKMLLSRLIYGSDKSPLEYIKKDYYLYYEDEEGYIYDFKIYKENEEIVIELKVDRCGDIDYLKTNMFEIKEGKNYYFKSTQEITTKSEDEPLELGTIVDLDIALTMKE